MHSALCTRFASFPTLAGKRILCTLDETESQWQSRAESRLSTTLDGGHRDDGLWSLGLFWTTKTRFQFDPRTGQKIEFTADTRRMGSDDEVGTTGESQQIMNKAIQEISAKKRAAAKCRTVTDTDGVVRIMGSAF